MREILFRGKRTTDGEWIEGGYFLEPYPNKAFMTRWNSFGMGFIEHIEVDPFTVGQYTGLKDKNGKRIFEGDIVKHYNHMQEPDAYDVGYIYFYDKYCKWKRTTSDRMYNPTRAEKLNPEISSAGKYEVIGNIHDNPELIAEVEGCSNQ